MRTDQKTQIPTAVAIKMRITRVKKVKKMYWSYVIVDTGKQLQHHQQ